MSSPAVSVIIVNYHAYDELATCLSSLSRQTIGVEVIVVDHDTSSPQVERLLHQFPNVRFIATQDNPGFAAGVNRGAAAASGEYLYLLNPDAEAEQSVCETLVTWLTHHPDVAVAGSMVRDEGGTIQASARRFPDITTAFGGRTTWLTKLLPSNPLTRRNLLTGDHVREPMLVDWVSGASMMIRRDIFESIGKMDEGFFLYWEDADLCRRMKDAGWSTAYVPSTSVTHLCGRSSKSSTASIRAFHASVFRYFRKHAGPLGILTLPLVFAALRARYLAVLFLRIMRV